jgi:hypothetical protein
MAWESDGGSTWKAKLIWNNGQKPGGLSAVIFVLSDSLDIRDQS